LETNVVEEAIKLFLEKRKIMAHKEGKIQFEYAGTGKEKEIIFEKNERILNEKHFLGVGREISYGKKRSILERSERG